MIRKGLIYQLTIGMFILALAACSSTPTKVPPTALATETPVEQRDLTIAVLGATGMVGGFILQEALEQGYNVRALARSPHKLDYLKDQISIVKGDARDAAVIDELLSGSDFVVSALGPVRGDGDAALMVSTVATGHIIELMPKHGIQQYLLVSGGGVNVPGDDRNFTGWLMQKLVSVALRDTLEDKQAEYELLAASAVPWTLLRCPRIVSQPFVEAPVSSLETPTAFNLRAGELARFMIDEISSQAFVGKAPFLNSQ